MSSNIREACINVAKSKKPSEGGRESSGQSAMVMLHVKTTAGKKFSVDVALESSVLQCKEALVAHTEVPAALQRLIFKGKVLKDDQTLESYGTSPRSWVSGVVTPCLIARMYLCLPPLPPRHRG
jgi:hypothetical protein